MATVFAFHFCYFYLSLFLQPPQPPSALPFVLSDDFLMVSRDDHISASCKPHFYISLYTSSHNKWNLGNDKSHTLSLARSNENLYSLWLLLFLTVIVSCECELCSPYNCYCYCSACSCWNSFGINVGRLLFGHLYGSIWYKCNVKYVIWKPHMPVIVTRYVYCCTNPRVLRHTDFIVDHSFCCLFNGRKTKENWRKQWETVTHSNKWPVYSIYMHENNGLYDSAISYFSNWCNMFSYFHPVWNGIKFLFFCFLGRVHPMDIVIPLFEM